MPKWYTRVSEIRWLNAHDDDDGELHVDIYVYIYNITISL
jgi:hypothetical protein